MRYPVTLTSDEGNILVTFPDVPEAITQGSNLKEALEQAVDALETALDFYFEAKRPVPSPSVARSGQEVVSLPSSVEAKVLLHNELLSQKVRPVDLAGRLGVSRQEITRMLNPRHSTKVDSIQKALEALGKHISFVVTSGQAVNVGQARLGQEALKLSRSVAGGVGQGLARKGMATGRATKAVAKAPGRTVRRKAV